MSFSLTVKCVLCIPAANILVCMSLIKLSSSIKWGKFSTWLSCVYDNAF